MTIRKQYLQAKEDYERIVKDIRLLFRRNVMATVMWDKYKFFHSQYFVPDLFNWHMKEDAPEELKKEFEEAMKKHRLSFSDNPDGGNP